MINSALEPLNCTVFGDFKWVRKYFPHSSSSNLYFLFQEIFPEGIFVVLFSRLYMSCAPFLLFRYIWIENGMMGFISLCRMLPRFKFFSPARIDLIGPEYCRKLIVTLYIAFISSYV